MGRGRGRGRGVTGVQWNYDAASTAAESASLLEPAAALHERTDDSAAEMPAKGAGKGGKGKGKGSKGKGKGGGGGGGRGGGVGGSPEGLEPDLDTLSMSDEPGVQEPPAARGGGKGKGKGKGKGGGGGGGGGEAVQKMDNSRPDSESLAHVLDKRKPYWWRRLTEVDPISLERSRRCASRRLSSAPRRRTLASTPPTLTAESSLTTSCRPARSCIQSRAVSSHRTSAFGWMST